MSDTQEREELEALLSTPGFLRLLRYARETWAGDGYAQRLKLAIRTATDKNQNIAEAVARVDAANDEINAVLSWPKQRADMLRNKEGVAKYMSELADSRRGTL